MLSTPRGGVAAKRGVDHNTVQPLIGVYLLMLKGRVVYIGASLNMPHRVADHRANGRPFDKVFHIATKANQYLELEATLIKAISRPQNRRGVTTPTLGGAAS
jgi:predicted GIY-YIG superfamily endonuclease